MREKIHPNVLRTAINAIAERADRFPYLEQHAVEIVEDAKKGDIRSLEVAIKNMENYLIDVLGFIWCETHRLLWEGDCPECQEKEE